jgi:hypothetical protein
LESKKTITELLDPRDLPADLYAELIRSPGSIHYDAGKIYLLAAQKVISFPDNAAGRELAETLRSNQSGADSSDSVKTDAFFRLLTGGTSPSDPIPDALRASRSRAVVVFRSGSPAETDFFQIFSGIAPVEEKDKIVRMDFYTVALIKDLQEQTAEELVDFCEAVIETMESEGIDKVKAGVGSIVSEPQALHDSYIRALRAIDLSGKYHLHGSVSVYDRLQLEQMLDCISPEAKAQMKSQLFSDPSVLSPELKETVAVFFKTI